jgi:hypothetical protein
MYCALKCTKGANGSHGLRLASAKGGFVPWYPSFEARYTAHSDSPTTRLDETARQMADVQNATATESTRSGLPGDANPYAGSAPGVSSFVLKVVAIIGMTADHAGVIFSDSLPFAWQCALVSLGGFTFPIMAFLLVEGYRHTSSVRKYAIRLGVFALISQVPFSLAFQPETITLGSTVLELPLTGNVLWTLLLGLFLLWANDAIRRRWRYWLLAIACIVASAALDWGVIGPIMIVAMGFCAPGRTRANVAGAIPLAALGIPALFAVAGGDLSALPDLLYELVGGTGALVLLRRYDGTRGRPLRWFFYVYYPAHIALLALVHALAA